MSYLSTAVQKLRYLVNRDDGDFLILEKNNGAFIKIALDTPAARDAAITTAVNNLLAGVPGALDTLNELATALGDDANFATTVTTALGARLKWRDAWAATTAYAINDLVLFNGGVYLAPTAFTSGASFVKANWTELSPQNGTYVSTVTGLDGTGAVDAYAAIQTALNTAGASAIQKEVRLPAGTFKVSNTLIVPSGVNLRGAGRGKTILRGTAGALPGVTVNGTTVYAIVAAVAASDVVVSHLTVDTFTNSTQANGIALVSASVTAGDYQGTSCSDCVVEFTEVLSWASHVYSIWAVATVRTTIAFNWINGNCSTTGTQHEGIEVAGGDDVLVLGNHLRNCGNDGINLPDIIANNTRSNIRVVFNEIDGADYGIGINNGGSIDANATITALVVAYNQIKNTRIRGISVTQSAGTTIDDVKIDHNQIHNPTGTGIGIVGNASATARNVEVTWNTVEGATAATTSDGSISIVNLTVKANNNTVYTSAAHGMFFSGCADSEAKNNTITSVQYSGILASSCARFVAQNNTIHSYNIANSSKPAIQVDTSSDPFVDGTATDKGTGTEYYSVYLTSGCDRGTIRGTKVLHQSALAPPSRNDGTNPSFGTAAAPTGTVTMTIPNTQVRTNMRVHVQQETGTPNAFRVVTSTSTITIVGAANWNGETIRYDILT